MGGSSGGGYTGRRGRTTQRHLTDDEINGCLRDQLRDYNDRDAEAIRRHLRGLRDALEIDDEDVIATLFGGSVSKHTYVAGLSDVDVLAIVNESSLSGRLPSDVIELMKQRITQRMPRTTVTTGDLAVAVKYADGTEMQLLPAIKTKSGIRIADPGKNAWSNVVHPARFSQKLTQINQRNDKKVVPTIKLAKGLIAHSVRSDRDHISGYHVESLAIEAFRNYRGSHDLKSMLRHFNDFASREVLQPIKDPTGQSRHVDDYMGPANSDRSRRASNLFGQMRRSLDRCKTRQDIENLFGA